MLVSKSEAKKFKEALLRDLERRAAQFSFERAAGSRDETHDATPIINDDIAREDAVRFRHQTAAPWRARC